jgi:hypothetical protein
MALVDGLDEFRFGFFNHTFRLAIRLSIPKLSFFRSDIIVSLSKPKSVKILTLFICGRPPSALP